VSLRHGLLILVKNRANPMPYYFYTLNTKCYAINGMTHNTKSGNTAPIGGKTINFREEPKREKKQNHLA